MQRRRGPIEPIFLEDVELLNGRYRNFSGDPTPFNKNGGERTFSVIIPENRVQELIDKGLNVKHTKDYEHDDGDVDPGVPFVTVKVRFDVMPPRVMLITSRNEQRLFEGDVEMLDTADFVNVDLTVNPRDYKLGNGDEGVTAYLKAGYFTIREDYFEEKYNRRREERENRRRGNEQDN